MRSNWIQKQRMRIEILLKRITTMEKGWRWESPHIALYMRTRA